MGPPTSEPLVFLNTRIATKLTRNNFLAWQSEILPVLHGYGVYKYISAPPPTSTITSDTGAAIDNPQHLSWHKQDQILLAWLRSSLSKTLFGQVVSCTTSADLWRTLQQTFSASSRALRRKLQHTTKGTSSCSEFIQKLRSIADELAYIGSPVSDDDLSKYILGGLGPEFDSFVAAANARQVPFTLRELHSSLINHENLLLSQNSNQSASLPSSTPRPNNPRPSNPGPSTRSNNPGPSTPRPNNSNHTRPNYRPPSPRASHSPGLLPQPSLTPNRPPLNPGTFPHNRMNNPPPQPSNHAPPQLPLNPPPQPPPKSLPELLEEHDLPWGLFPKTITGYNFDVNTRNITVDMPGICDVSCLRFSNTVTGCLERGRLNHINGIRAESLTWEEVHCIEIKSKRGKLHLHLTGKVDKLRPLDEFCNS